MVVPSSCINKSLSIYGSAVSEFSYAIVTGAVGEIVVVVVVVLDVEVVVVVLVLVLVVEVDVEVLVVVVVVHAQLPLILARISSRVSPGATSILARYSPS
jgi:hypothetical protein